ncbi:unnamed protein product, partial [Ectocarpus fasciculatus]
MPVWLDRSRLPAPSELTCGICFEPLSFVLQIYCPLDSPDSAYHRCLYTFCCRKASCVQGGRYSFFSVKCFRAQCSKKEWENRAEVASTLCAVCGCNSPLACSRCKTVHYCSKGHQKVHWAVHKHCCDSESAAATECTTPANFPNIVFPEYDLVVEPEIVGDELVQGDESQDALAEAMSELLTYVPEGDEDEDEDLTQNDYDKAIGAESTDPTYIKFLARVRRGGADQVLRYTQPRSGVPGPIPRPLPVATGSAMDADSIPPCECCGSARQFEFQIMPQLLFYLNDIDWNSVDIYTCSANCSPLDLPTSAYKQEFVHLQ